MSIAVKVEHLSKRYRLGSVDSNLFKEEIGHFLSKISGRKIEENFSTSVNDRTIFGDSKYVWSLKDISFDINEGEVLGIVGKNGAGKSTLLKILSKVTAPTEGTVKTRGKISSLLEVGTGFHPELSGRENIYLNGAILGMRKKEITSKLEEIIEFAGIQRYIDTPVKRYSSGMYVRLAFAVAAHLESDILIIDEVLAVGDAEFQKKCLSKMKDVSSKSGKTVLFVSHNMDAIERLCNKAIFLQNGMMIADGGVKSVLDQYLSNNFQLTSKSSFSTHDFSALPFEILSFFCHKGSTEISETFSVTERIGITIEFSVKSDKHYFIPAISVLNDKEVDVFHAHDVESEHYKTYWNLGKYTTTVWIPENILNEGNYTIGLGFLSHLPFHVYFHEKELLKIKVSDLIKGDSARGLYNGDFPGIFRPKLNWETKKILL